MKKSFIILLASALLLSAGCNRAPWADQSPAPPPTNSGPAKVDHPPKTVQVEEVVGYKDEQVQVGTTTERYVSGYRSEQVQVGTQSERYVAGYRTERVQTGWTTKRVHTGWRNERVQTGWGYGRAQTRRARGRGPTACA